MLLRMTSSTAAQTQESGLDTVYKLLTTTTREACGGISFIYTVVQGAQRCFRRSAVVVTLF